MVQVWANNTVENKLRRSGQSIIAGADEVGRGALAGPMVVAVVVLDPKSSLPVCDSKMLSRNKRVLLAQGLSNHLQAAAYGWVWPGEIDKLGITQSLTQAYIRALESFPMPVSRIILDGNYNYLEEYELAFPVIRADQSCRCVAAASILAKVARDEYMIKIANKFPWYDFENNVGYGTRSHRQSIIERGHSVVHRQSFKLT